VEADVALDKLKTEHTGAKNGGGGYGHRADVKHASNRRRRRESRRQERQGVRDRG
jgi:hypothetical protein